MATKRGGKLLRARVVTGTPGHRIIYGINTGFGFLQQVHIDDSQLEQLQYNLLKSHACGMGEQVPHDIIRPMLMLKIKSLSYGHSGVQIDTVKRTIEIYRSLPSEHVPSEVQNRLLARLNLPPMDKVSEAL